VILEAKRKIAAAITIADANPIVIADENNDCENILMNLRTKYTFHSKISVPLYNFI
jgi:hypothetical protein